MLQLRKELEDFRMSCLANFQDAIEYENLMEREENRYAVFMSRRALAKAILFGGAHLDLAIDATFSMSTKNYLVVNFGFNDPGHRYDTATVIEPLRLNLYV